MYLILVCVKNCPMLKDVRTIAKIEIPSVFRQNFISTTDAMQAIKYFFTGDKIMHCIHHRLKLSLKNSGLITFFYFTL